MNILLQLKYYNFDQTIWLNSDLIETILRLQKIKYENLNWNYFFK